MSRRIAIITFVLSLWGAALGVWGLSGPMLGQTQACYRTSGCSFEWGVAGEPLCDEYTPEFIHDRRETNPTFCKGYPERDD